jgi:hypothetical protein
VRSIVEGMLIYGPHRKLDRNGSSVKNLNDSLHSPQLPLSINHGHWGVDVINNKKPLGLAHAVPCQAIQCAMFLPAQRLIISWGHVFRIPLKPSISSFSLYSVSMYRQREDDTRTIPICSSLFRRKFFMGQYIFKLVLYTKCLFA